MYLLIKRYTITLILLLGMVSAFAQIPLGVTTNVLPPYPSQFAVWAGNSGNYFVTISNNSDLSFEVFVRISLQGTDVNGEPIDIKIIDEFRPASGFHIPPFGVVQLDASDFEDSYSGLGIEHLDLSPNIPLDLDGELPSGSYVMCAEVIEFNQDPTEDPVFLSPVICSDLFTVSTNNIELIWPIDQTEVPKEVAVNFGWMVNSSLGTPGDLQEYQLKLYELDSLQAQEESIYELIESGALPPLFTSEHLFEKSYLYDENLGEMPLTPGYLYAAQVEVVETNGLFYNNGAKSNISSFWYDFIPTYEETDPVDEGEEISENQQDCFENCVLEVSQNSTLSTANEFNQIKVGHFEIVDIEDLNQINTGNYSGTGRVKVPFFGSDNGSLYVNVAFENIKVNSANELIEGEVVAVVDAIPDPGGLPTEAVFNDFVKSNRLVGSVLGSETTMNLPIGINQNLLGSYFLIGMTSMKFTATGATVDVKCNIHLPQFGSDNWIALSSSDMCLHPQGWGGEFLLHMDYDQVIKYKDQISFAFKGLDDADSNQIMNEACYLQMDCNGIKSLALQAEIDIPGGLLVKDTETGIPGDEDEPVKGEMSILLDRELDDSQNVYIENGSEEPDEFDDSGFHFVAKIALDSFQVKNLCGWGFSVDDVWFDGSEVAKIPGMQFPEDYDGWDINGYDNTTNINPVWTGIYIEKMEMRAPKEFLGGERRATASINHAIIDPQISMTVSVDSLFGLDEGKVDNWQFSLENLFLSVEQGRVESGGFGGRLGMPITGEDEYLEYTAIIQDSNDDAGTDPVEFVFSVNPENDITIPLMVASAVLEDNSYITAKFTPNNSDNTYFAAGLFGEVNIDTETIQDEGMWENNGGLPLKLPLLDFGFEYHSKEGFDNAHFSFLDGVVVSDDTNWESHQIIQEGNEYGVSREQIVGLPLSIESISLSSVSLDEAVLTILPRVVLGGDSFTIAGETTLNMASTLGGTNKFGTPSFSISAVKIENDIAGLYCSGYLEFYNTIANNPDGVGAKGMKGDLEVLLPMGVGVKMAAEFGSQVNDPLADYGTEDNFPYWYFDGMVYFGAAAGIPISPGVGVYGLGGGVSYNMTRSSYTNEDGEVDQAAVENQIAEQQGASPESINRTGSNPTVAYGVMGMKLAGTFGTHPSPTAFNADVSFEAEFSGGIGLSLLSIRGAAYLMTPLGDRNSASVYATAFLTYENLGGGNLGFMGGIDVYVNTPMIYGDPDNNNKMISATFLAETINKQEKWYFHVGSPDQPGTLNVDLYIATAKATGYFMLGHDLPTTLPIPDKIAEFFGSANGSGGNSLSSETLKTEEPRSDHSMMMAEMGTGIAFGVTAEVELNVDAFGVYAKLGVFLGLDVNVTKTEGSSCYIPGEGNIEPGINGWYGNGQVYAGLEGELGFRVKALGKDHDLRLFYLGAAMQLRGGGPNPAWAEGRMGLRIEVLGGLIKCNKSIEVKVGETCIPAVTDPFGGIPPIVDHFPKKGDKDVSPLANPTVDFTFPMDQATAIPTLQDNGDYKTMYITPKLQSVTVWCKKDDENIGVEYKWSDENRHLKFDLEHNLTPKSRVEVDITLVAYESDSHNSLGSRVRLDDGTKWQLDTMFHFRTGEAGPIDEELITTVPGRMQKNFLANEASSILKRIYLEDPLATEDYFFEEDDNYTYDYFFRMSPMDGGEVIETSNINVSYSTIQEINYGLQLGESLQQDEIYACQLIRKGTRKESDTNVFQAQFFDLGQIGTDYKLESDTELVFQNLPPAPGESVDANEFALISYHFRTSSYETASDKLDALEMGLFFNYYDDLSLNFDTEGFDDFDLFGETFEEELVQSPVFQIFDPFNEPLVIGFGSGNYYSDHVREKFVDFKDKFHTKKDNFNWEFALWPTGDLTALAVNSMSAGVETDTLMLDYKDDMRLLINPYMHNFGFGLLSQDQVDAAWAETLVDQGVENVTVPGFVNWKSTFIEFPTMEFVTDDSQTLTDWGATLLSINYLSYDIGADWPKFESTWLDQISNSYDFTSHVNPGTFQLSFEINRSLGYQPDANYEYLRTKNFQN